MTLYLTIYIFGLLAAFLALIIEIVSAISPITVKLDSARHVGLLAEYFLTWAGIIPLVLIAAIEEVARYTFLRQFVRRFRVSDAPFGLTEKLLLGTIFGLGFASLEAFLILEGQDHNPSGLQLTGIVLLHVCMSILFSFLLLKSSTPKLFHTLFTLGLAILLHTAYNLGILLYS